jgi:hypothetical protein
VLFVFNAALPVIEEQNKTLFTRIAAMFSNTKNRNAKLEFVSSFLMLPVFLADTVLTIYYTITLVDQDILITAPALYARVHTRWYDWIPMAHYFLFMIAIGNALVAVNFVREVALIIIVVVAFACLLVDILIVTLAPDENTVGMYLLRWFMVIVDIAYVVVGSYGIYNPKDQTVALPDKMEDEDKMEEESEMVMASTYPNKTLRSRGGGGGSGLESGQ